MVVDEKNPEDVDTRQEDHAYDDLRYFLMSLSFNIKNVHNDPENANIDDGSRREWDWFRKRCKEMSRNNEKAIGSDINNINA